MGLRDVADEPPTGVLSYFDPVSNMTTYGYQSEDDQMVAYDTPLTLNYKPIS